MLIMSLFHKLQKCTLNLGIFWYSSWSYSEMFFAPMWAWESFPGPCNNVYKNILGNALLPPKLFQIKLMNTRLIFSQVTQKGPINSYFSWKICSQIFPNFLAKKSSKGPNFLYRWSTFWPFLKGAECWPSGRIFGTCRQAITACWCHELS